MLSIHANLLYVNTMFQTFFRTNSKSQVPHELTQQLACTPTGSAVTLHVGSVTSAVRASPKPSGTANSMGDSEQCGGQRAELGEHLTSCNVQTAKVLHFPLAEA